MSSWVVTRVSRSLSFEFIRQLSKDPANIVFGLIRDKVAVKSKVTAKIGQKNIHIIQADTTDPIALAAESHDPNALEQDMIKHFRVNTIGAVHLFNAFIPLILKGRAKKVIAISTGISDPKITLKADIYQAASYAISKAALNIAIAKFSALYQTEEEGQLAIAMFGKFKQYSPTFQGPIKPEHSAKSVLALVKKATVDSGYTGVFLSHTESKPYL
ncbi:hypothetical protein N7509_003033 [Penicillium cosmopolitanum]|uniref:Uncharacterized protein n=1 Tax=Penicillium cosmopolitanum TaxID=1131564 RepID=A0A9W9WAL0_9EURO|nr:uncharacterized protein N7509_003033 [Penicillium cosmopolitanum]KAJ5409150.1 hypothetical protein N7509_003033 [Penicillium cosmopolitanum]